jgi:hypothetical protein
MAELEVWGGERELYLRWRCRDRGQWYYLLDSFKEWFPGPERRYHADDRTWSVPRSQRASLVTWADLHFGASEQRWERSAGRASRGRHSTRPC